MNFGRSDLRKVQVSVLGAVLMLLVAAIVLYVAYQLRDKAQQARVAITAQRSDADGKLKRVRDEEYEIRQKSILFNQLKERGIIGDEQRLEWVELLKDIRDKRRLIDLQYEIAPQRLLDGKSAGEFAFSASAMKLRVKLLHEEDLSRLLADLRSQAKALIQVKGCNVERLPSTADERTSGRASLLADCEIDWLTVREVNRK
jgi:hypothetical protein